MGVNLVAVIPNEVALYKNGIASVVEHINGLYGEPEALGLNTIQAELYARVRFLVPSNAEEEEPKPFFDWCEEFRAECPAEHLLTLPQASKKYGNAECAPYFVVTPFFGIRECGPELVQEFMASMAFWESECEGYYRALIIKARG
jgi:hypothetical protein